MPDPKDQMNKFASGYQDALASPTPSTCPTCGHSTDDVPDPDPKGAKDFSKGATKSGYDPKQWMKNLKEGLGIE